MSTAVAAAAPLAPPPATRAQPVTETVQGETFVDPYRWLEDGDAPAVAAWTDAQNAYTARVLGAIPGRASLEARLWALHEIGSLGTPVPRPFGPKGNQRWRYFYTRRDGKQNQSILYVRDPDARPGPDRALVDVNSVAADGTSSLDWWFPSEDGALVAYGVSADGSEESVLRVRDVKTGRDLPEVIDRTRACSVAWLPDGSGFYYTRHPARGTVPAGEENYHRTVYFHRLGGDASGAGDAQVFGAGRDHRDWPAVALSPNGRYLAVEVSQGWSRTELYVLDRKAPEGKGWITIAAGEEAIFNLEEITDQALLVRTNKDAPRYHLFRVPLAASKKPPESATGPVRGAWRELIPQSAHALQQVVLAGKRLAALYLEDAVSRVHLFDLEGRPSGTVALPGLGTVNGLSSHPESNELFLPFTSFLAPTTILRTTPEAGTLKASAETTPTVWLKVAAPVDPQKFVVTQERFKSKDGTEIPLFLVHRRDVVRDGRAPAVLYGYGGFNVNITPGWSPSIVPFLERGGVYALAVLRGGGEYGEAWHRAGMLANKQNVFDDFIGAAEYLIASKVTRSERLAIMGRSNGGLLMGAALTQRPELFRAVICGVPLLDMLRYHRFRIAQLWIPEYGSSEDATAFRWLRAYSPYHHVRPRAPYPAVLFTTAASDTRVDPLHARKMTALLQAANTAPRPILLRLETKAGHGAGKPLGKVIAQLVDEWAFLFSELGLAAANE